MTKRVRHHYLNYIYSKTNYIYKKFDNLYKTIFYTLYLNLPLRDKHFIMGTPEHDNIGDSAIAVAEIAFLRRELGSHAIIRELTVREIDSYLHLMWSPNAPTNHYYWHGGGNMGDEWYSEEKFRRKHILAQLSTNPIILPQTIWYSDTVSGQQKLEESKACYNHSCITIVARESNTFRLLHCYYPKATILITPDVVLSTTMQDYGVSPQNRCGVLFCVRSDREKKVDNSVWEHLESTLNSMSYHVRYTDMIQTEVPVTKKNRKECVRLKMQEFCRAELVITDRLHGMVFAALTGTPCIVFSNYNYKVEGTYNWIKELSYIRYVENEESAKCVMLDLLKMRSCECNWRALESEYSDLATLIKENHRTHCVRTSYSP